MIKQTGHCISGALPVSGMNELKRFSGVLSFLPSLLPAGVYVKSDASFSVQSIVFPSESLRIVLLNSGIWCDRRILGMGLPHIILQCQRMRIQSHVTSFPSPWGRMMICSHLKDHGSLSPFPYRTCCFPYLISGQVQEYCRF